MALILDPTASCGRPAQQLRRTLSGLSGKVVGFIDDTKPNFDHLVDDLGELLVKRYGVSTIIKERKHSSSRAASEALISKMAESCDAVITGSGD
jgi:hypothetical protein